MSEWLSSTKQTKQTKIVGEDKKEPLCTAGGNIISVTLLGEQYGGSSKLKIELPYDQVISFTGVYSKGNENT